MSLRVGVDARELQGRPTGTGRYLHSLLRAWIEDGEDQFVAYVQGEPDAALPASGVVVRQVGRPGSGLRWQQLDLPRAAAGDRLDVFFSPAYTCPLALAVPRVTAVHDLSFFSLPAEFGALDGLRRRLLVGASVAASARVLACSRFTRDEIAACFPDAAPRTAVVPLGRDEALLPAPDRAEARRALGVTGPCLLTVGTILDRRRLPELVRATALLARRHPGLTLLVAGEDRSRSHADLPALATRLGAAGAVRVLGFVDEAALAQAYAAADVAVFLSEYEGFGLPPLEAVARGVPLVVADRPALSDVFGGAAMRVDSRDPEGVAEAVEAILRQPDLRQDLVARGRALAARHTWRETARLTRAALGEAAGR